MTLTHCNFVTFVIPDWILRGCLPNHPSGCFSKPTQDLVALI